MAGARFEVKGSLLRGFLDALAKENVRDKVLERATNSTRELVASLPPASSWVDGDVMFDLNRATLELLGADALERLTLAGNRAALSKAMTFAVESLMRLFGVSPATVFSRMNQMASSTTRGLDYQWTSTGARAGSLRITFVNATDIPAAAWISIRGGLRLVFDYCKLDGKIAPHALLPGARGNASDFALQW